MTVAFSAKKSEKKSSWFSRGRAAAAATLAAATAVAGAVTFTDEAQAAGDRGVLRPGCTWDAYNYYTQYCQVHSDAMGKDIPVQIVASTNGGDKALYLLDGLRSPQDASDWVGKGNAPRVFEGSNVNLVIPGGGTASFYTDWQRPSLSANGPFNYKWETFLTQELPVYLEQNFGISRTGNSIAGLSMGASAALSLAYNHRDQFGQAISFSGYLHTTAPGMNTAITLAMLDAGGYSNLDMWGLPLSPERVRNDPYLNMDKMAGLDLLITASAGEPGVPGDTAPLYNESPHVGGAGLEVLSRLSTEEFERKARSEGLAVTFQYADRGVHDWPTWERNLADARSRIEAFLGA